MHGATVRLCASGAGTTVNGHHVLFVVRTEGHIEDALVAEAIAFGPGLAAWFQVLHDFQQHVTGKKQTTFLRRAGQGPKRLV
ncbi:hypothetical protein D9M73_212890 [compost metagenome]